MAEKYKIYTKFVPTKQKYEISDSDTEEIKFLKNFANENDIERIHQTGTVFMQSNAFEKIFNKKLKGTNRERRFIKIKSLETGKTVYRVLRAKTGSFELKDIVYADSETRDILTDKSHNESIELEITKSNRLMNYLHNYDLFDRMNFRIAAISFCLGIISLILGILPLVIH